MNITRKWTPANKNTFEIPAVRDLLKRYQLPGLDCIDPFARDATIGTITNDLNPNTAAQWHQDALHFSEMCRDSGWMVERIVFDPPYSNEQIKRAYEGVGRRVTQTDTQLALRWTQLKKHLSRCLVLNGVAISFGWSTYGFGKKLGFEIIEILLLCHGAGHHDTICTVERKTAE
jgi:hypothetical protein